MGAAWKVRRNLNLTHGDALGDMIADSLLMGKFGVHSMPVPI